MASKEEELLKIYKQLKRQRVVLNKDEFAKKLNYSRAQLHRIINERKVTQELIEMAKALLNDTKFVSHETITLNDGNTIAGFLKVIQQHTEIILNQSQTIKNLTEPPDLAKNA